MNINHVVADRPATVLQRLGRETPSAEERSRDWSDQSREARATPRASRDALPAQGAASGAWTGHCVSCVTRCVTCTRLCVSCVTRCDRVHVTGCGATSLSCAPNATHLCHRVLRRCVRHVTRRKPGHVIGHCVSCMTCCRVCCIRNRHILRPCARLGPLCSRSTYPLSVKRASNPSSVHEGGLQHGAIFSNANLTGHNDMTSADICTEQTLFESQQVQVSRHRFVSQKIMTQIQRLKCQSGHLLRSVSHQIQG